MLSVLGSVCLFLSMFVYSCLLKDLPIRSMMVIASVTNFIGAVTTFMYVKNITFGLSPLVFVVLTDTVTSILVDAFTRLPAMVLFAKLTPHNIESSMFALVTGVMNFCNGFMSKQLGVLINKSVGVTNSNLNELWRLYFI